MRRQARFIVLIVAAVLASPITGAYGEEPFAAGTCAITRQRAEFKDSNGQVTGPKLPAASYLKILSARPGLVEVTWIPSLIDGCNREAGVFAGWVRRRDMAREYNKAGRNPFDSVQPSAPAPIFDRPDGRAVGQAAMNAKPLGDRQKG